MLFRVEFSSWWLYFLFLTPGGAAGSDSVTAAAGVKSGARPAAGHEQTPAAVQEDDRRTPGRHRPAAETAERQHQQGEISYYIEAVKYTHKQQKQQKDNTNKVRYHAT